MPYLPEGWYTLRLLCDSSRSRKVPDISSSPCANWNLHIDISDHFTNTQVQQSYSWTHTDIMAANDQHSRPRKRSVSFADEPEPYRSDSMQESRLSVVTTLTTAINRIETTSAATIHFSRDIRRSSLAAAVHRASTRLGDGLCESRKELALLGILPEPESSEDEDSLVPVDMLSSEEANSSVVPTTIPEGEEWGDGGFSPKDTVRNRDIFRTSNKGLVLTRDSRAVGKQPSQSRGLPQKLWTAPSILMPLTLYLAQSHSILKQR